MKLTRMALTMTETQLYKPLLDMCVAVESNSAELEA